MEVKEKIERIRTVFLENKKVMVAFSGGVDSSLLARIGYDALGDNCIAVTVKSETFPERELEHAKRMAEEIGIRHYIISHSELNIRGVAENREDRCYHCKRGLFRTLANFGKKIGFKVIAEGTNRSELSGHRPGFRAVMEYNVITPLRDLTKKEIREIARYLGLSNWNRPSMACLSSRIPFGIRITQEKIKIVEKAEDYLFNLGVKTCRVRYHEDLARIEVLPEDFALIIKHRKEISEYFQSLGFRFISLDIEGYRSGSLSTPSEVKNVLLD